MIMNKSSLKLNVDTMYVQNVLRNYLNKMDNMNVHNVDKKIGLYQQTKNNILITLCVKYIMNYNLYNKYKIYGYDQ